MLSAISPLLTMVLNVFFIAVVCFDIIDYALDVGLDAEPKQGHCNQSTCDISMADLTD
jgi:hypothetical protein